MRIFLRRRSLYQDDEVLGSVMTRARVDLSMGRVVGVVNIERPPGCFSTREGHCLPVEGED